MTELQKSYYAYIESVCKKVGCLEAVDSLREGFTALCEAYDPYEMAARQRTIGQLRNNIKVTSPTGEVRENNTTATATPTRKPTVIGATKPKSREEIERDVDSEHPEFTNENGNVNIDSYDARKQMIAQRQCEQFQKNNEEVARRNAALIAQYPFEQIKQMFPSAYCKVQGEVWVRKFLKKERDKATGDIKVVGAIGRWEPDFDSEHYENPTMAADAAKRKYSPKHWKVYTVIPELQAEIPNVIPSDR